MRWVVLGAGAVGGYFGGRLALAGEDVFFLARGAHLDALRRTGLTVQGARGDFTVHPPAADDPTAAEWGDVLVVTVKTYDTEAAAAPCVPLLPPDGVVLTLQNGLGNVEALGVLFGPDRVIGGVAYVGAEVVAPGRIVQQTGGRVVIGEIDGTETPRARRLRDAFERAQVPCEIAPNLDQAIWEKLVANAVFNVIASAFDCQLGDILWGEKRLLADRAIAELLAIARARHIEVRPKAVEACFAFCDAHPDFRTSTQQDLARGRPTEIGALSDAVIAEAHHAGVPAPTHEMLAHRLRMRTEARQNDRPKT